MKQSKIAGSIVITVLMVCALAIVLVAQPDPAIGTWKLNVAKSTYNPGPAPKSSTVMIEKAGEGVKVSVKTMDPEGKPVELGYTANYDGKDYPVTGTSDYDTLSVKRTDDLTIQGDRKKAGKVVQSYSRILSKDGKSMTVTVRGTNAKGQKIHNVAVYDRQ